MSNKEERAARLERACQIYSLGEEEAQAINREYERNRNHRTCVAVGRESLFFTHLQRNLEKFFKAHPPKPSSYSLKKHKEPVGRILNLMLSDLHFGANLSGLDTPLKYGPNEEARRLAHVVHEVCSYKIDHRDETVLYIHLLGDIIQNQLHDPRDGKTLTEQQVAAIGLLTQAIEFAASHFRKVVVRCTPGNHGRNTARHRERATNEKWDSLETVIYYAIAHRVTLLPNVTVEIPKTPYFVYKAFDQWGWMTHGDGVFKFGYPGRSVDSGRIEAQINAFIASEALKNPSLGEAKLYSLVGGGHVHIGSCTYLSNGAACLTNGPLIPTDAYGLSQGHMTCTCGQWMWESVKGHIIGDQRFIKVGIESDSDHALEKIIKPVIF